MPTTIRPLMHQMLETTHNLENMEDIIKSAFPTNYDLLLSHPVIYIHVWRNKDDITNGTWSIYVGETNDILTRTSQHWDSAKKPKSKRKKGDWQYHMIEDVDDKGNQVIPTIYIIGHKLFQKSLTLDIENRLIDFCYSMDKTANCLNGRGNPQGYYEGDKEFDTIFSMIWRMLRADNQSLFLTESSIIKSAMYKASPNHQLTSDQRKAKQMIISRTVDALVKHKRGQLIFIEGDAGTGKTVLACSAFFDSIESELLKSLNISSCMIVRHPQQLTVYKDIAKKLGYPENIIQEPTHFLNTHSVLNRAGDRLIPDISKIVDLVFVDEAHLLWDQNNRGFTKKYPFNQLDEIMKRARVTVILYDENQVLDVREIPSLNFVSNKKHLAQSQGPNPVEGVNNYYSMSDQLRMNCSTETLNWIDSFTKNRIVTPLSLDSKKKDSEGYEIRIFDSPQQLHSAIKRKASKDETQLSRVIATYDWKYVEKKVHDPTPVSDTQRYYQVDIHGWTLPWNNERYRMDIYPTLNYRQRNRYNNKNWAEKDYSIEEAGSTFTIQGFDLSYAGVIIGQSVKYNPDTNEIWFDPEFRPWEYSKGLVKLRDGNIIDATDIISMHELRVLLTRGTKGLYIYAENPELRRLLKDSITYT